MFKLLDRYLIKTIFMAIGLMMLILLGLLLLMGLMGEARNVGEGDYYFLQSFYYVLMRLPSELYRFSPILVLLGAIIGTGVLSSSFELSVMRAAGYSVGRVVRNVLFAGFIFISMMLVLGEVLGPFSAYQAEIYRENAKNAGLALVTASGIWLHIDNNFIHVERVVGKEWVKGITRYEVNSEQQLIAAYYADTLIHKNKKWEWHNVVKTTLSDDHSKSEFFPQLEWDLPINSNLFQIGFDNPSDMSLSKLTHMIDYLARNGLETRVFSFQLWRRILQPLSSTVMILVAVPFVLGSHRGLNLGSRVMIGLFFGFTFFILNAMLSQLAIVYQLPTFIAASLSPLLFSLIAFGLFRKLVKN